MKKWLSGLANHSRTVSVRAYVCRVLDATMHIAAFAMLALIFIGIIFHLLTLARVGLDGAIAIMPWDPLIVVLGSACAAMAATALHFIPGSLSAFLVALWYAWRPTPWIVAVSAACVSFTVFSAWRILAGGFEAQLHKIQDLDERFSLDLKWRIFVAIGFFVGAHTYHHLRCRLASAEETDN